MLDLVFSQLVPVSQLQQLLEAQFKLLGVPCAILDNHERVLVSVGWQRICTEFHRRHPQTVVRCRQSEASVKDHLDQGRPGYHNYRCQNGLWDVAVPIFIDNRHLATFFAGQFFYDDEPPDRETFRAQAIHFGFDEDNYLAAMEDVPSFSRDYIRDVMNYCRSLLEMVAETGLKNLRLDREVQKRKKSEKEASFFRYLVENTRDPIYALDLNNRFRMFYVNAAACTHFGWDRTTMLQMRVPDWDPEFDLARLSELHQQVQQWDQVRAETMHLTASGDRVPVEVTASYLEFDGRELLVGSFHDISERKAMEAALKEREHNLVEAQRIARVGNWVWDLHSRLQAASAECWRLLGASAESFAGNEAALLELICTEDRERVRSAISGLLRERRPCTVEYRLRRSDGTNIVVRDQRELVFDESDKPSGVVGTIQDITEQVRLAEELRKKDLLLQQQSRMAAMGEMINYIAHQWRQPLHLLTLLLYNLVPTADGGGSDEQRRIVAQAEDLLQHMSSTVDDFSKFFRTDRGPMPFDLHEVVGKMLKLIAVDLEKHRIKTVFEAEDGLIVTGYGNEFSHVLLNILNNAKQALVDAGVAAPHIHIHMFTEKGKKVVIIRDNAGGVPETVRRQLFEPYFTTKESGTGIGLYIAETIIQKRMQGSISARNTGDGLEFRIEL